LDGRTHDLHGAVDNMQNSEPRAKRKLGDDPSAVPVSALRSKQTAAGSCADGELRFVREVKKTDASCASGLSSAVDASDVANSSRFVRAVIQTDAAHAPEQQAVSRRHPMPFVFRQLSWGPGLAFFVPALDMIVAAECGHSTGVQKSADQHKRTHLTSDNLFGMMDVPTTLFPASAACTSRHADQVNLLRSSRSRMRPRHLLW
jgi:hypothetical protein